MDNPFRLLMWIGLIFGTMVLFVFLFFGFGILGIEQPQGVNVEEAGESFAETDGSIDLTGVAPGSRWKVVQLPPHWKQYYTDEQFEELRQEMQAMVDQYKLPADEFMGLLDVESAGGNPRACSTVGAVGFGQFMPGTARGMKEFNYIDETIQRITGTMTANKTDDRCNPIKSIRASARKLATDRKGNGGEDWGTLKWAYVGVRITDSKGRRRWKFTAYNPGVEHVVWDGGTRRGQTVRGIKTRADEFRNKGYVVPIDPNRSTGTSLAGEPGSPTSPLGARTLQQLSQKYLGQPYVRYPSPNTVGCFNCQTLVEQVMIDALAQHLNDEARARSIIRGKAYPIPDWIENSWPARDITNQVGVSSLQTVTRPHFNNRTLSYQYIPGSAASQLNAQAVDGAIVALVVTEQASRQHQSSKGAGLIMGHVGFLFNESGRVTFRHASQRQRRVVDQPFASYFSDLDNRFIGFMVLRPDLSRIPE